MIDAIQYAFIMIMVGFIALRFAGRKSISRMTIAQTVIMIAVGSILVEPVKNKDLWVTTISIFVFIIVLILLEFLSSRFAWFETWIVGDKKIVIREGKIDKEALNKLRMTIDQLEMTLRQKGINDVSKIKVATLEANGNIGYEYFPQYKHLTVEDFHKLTHGFFDDYAELQKGIMNLDNQKESEKD